VFSSVPGDSEFVYVDSEIGSTGRWQIRRWRSPVDSVCRGRPRSKTLQSETWCRCCLTTGKLAPGGARLTVRQRHKMNDRRFPRLQERLQVHPPSSSGNRFEARGAVVYDRKTSLLWQRCSVGQRWSNEHCVGKAQTFTWLATRDLGAGGWRLPTYEGRTFRFRTYDQALIAIDQSHFSRYSSVVG
jgi:hypothetical protein